MVIQKFNKLIRNKWLWGAFAIAISAFFAFDFLIADLGAERPSETSGGAGTLAGQNVDAKLFLDLAEDVPGIGRQRASEMKQGDVNRQAWENYAALKVAEELGLQVTDAEVASVIRSDPTFQQNGAFSFALYQRALRDNSITPERFEVFLKRRLTLARLAQSVLGSAAWISPMELDQMVADMTDVFTVRVATFRQAKKDADAVKVDDAAVKAWYDKNQKSLELPERIKVRLVKFNAADTNLLARMTVTEDEMRDRYDATIDKYTSTDTNGVETVKKFEDVKGAIEKDLRLIAAVQCLETNLNFRVYATPAKKDAAKDKDGRLPSRLDAIAKEDGLKVETSDWFSLEGGYQEGFMKRAYLICPGAQNFAEALAELDMESEDLRYAVVSSPRAVWLVEKVAVSPKHVPTFDEAKDAIKPRVLRDAKADAFKAQIEAVAKKGVAAVEAEKTISTNVTFSVADVYQGENSGIANAAAVASAAMKLKKGEVSEFAPTGVGQAILVVCKDRVPGDAAKTAILRSQIQESLEMALQRPLPAAWMKWNLERLGFEPGEVSSVVNPEEVDE